MNTFNFLIRMVSALLLCSVWFSLDTNAQDSRDQFVAKVAGTSNWPPPAPSDEIFVASEGGDLDVGICGEDTEYLRIELPVNRFVGEVDAEGYLVAPQDLINQGVLTKFVELQLVVLDVDSPREIDRVYFNGEEIGFLYGKNDTWQQDLFYLPVEKVKFPNKADLGSSVNPRSDPRINVIEIEVDVDYSGYSTGWCVLVDWVSLRSADYMPLAWRPVLFAHGLGGWGLGGDPSVWGYPDIDPDLDEYEQLTWRRTLGYDKNIETHAIDLTRLTGSATVEINSSEIAQMVEDMRQAYGVDQVNIVAHSKGGVDSRYYLWRNIRPRAHHVNELVMLGTPNAGSKSAGHWANLTKLFFIGQGMKQMTPKGMSNLNLRIKRHPQTRYITLAGDHQFLPGQVDREYCSTVPWRWMLKENGINPPSDCIVTVESVHHLEFATNLLYSSSDVWSTHSGLYKSSFIYGTITGEGNSKVHTRSRVVAPSSTIESASFLPQPLSALNSFGSNSALAKRQLPPSRSSVSNVQLTTSTAGEVQAVVSHNDTIFQGESRTHFTSVDTASEAIFLVTWPSDDLTFALIDPVGTRIDSISAAADPNVEYSKTDVFFEQNVIFYHVTNPMTGTWSLEITGVSVTDPAGAEYATGAFLDGSSISISINTDQDYYLNTDPITISATLLDGSTPITGVPSMAYVILPDSSLDSLSLFDDGSNGDLVANDGQYTAIYSNTTLAGDYSIFVTAEQATGVAFSRQDYTSTTVAASRSGLSGSFGDTGIDSDGDGLFDTLQLNVGVDIDVPATYTITAYLRGSSGEMLDALVVDSTLSAGSHTLQFSVDGHTLFQQGTNGPYTLEELVLLETQQGLMVDFIETAHTTAAYSTTEFQRPPIFPTGNFNDTGVDSEGDGLFEYLKVDVEVDLLRSGNYTWSASLVDSTGILITYYVQDSPSQWFDAGVTNLSLLFDGTEILERGIDGPYVVRALGISNDIGDGYADSFSIPTQAYEALDFAQGATVISITSGIGRGWEGPSPWGDYDQDGDIDLALHDYASGWDMRIMRTVPTGFINTVPGLPGVAYGNSAWGDYDNDGDLDLVLTGQDDTSNYIARIYQNDDGAFSDILAGLPGLYFSAVAWGDYDNDGNLDLLVTGAINSSSEVTQLYRNDGSTFTLSQANLPDVHSGSVAWGDYDNDDDLDLLISGSHFDPIYLTNKIITRIYRNDNSTFSVVSASLTGVYNSYTAWGDYDNDGDLDMVVTGLNSSNIPTALIYRNDNGTFSDIQAGLTGVAFSHAAWGDYDNDGDLDLLITGATTPYEPYNAITRIYGNNGDGTFSVLQDYPGVKSYDSGWGDYDNDGDLDLFISGTNDSNVPVYYLYDTETAPNATPAAPTGLAAVAANGGMVLSWNAPLDDTTPQQALSYNVRIGTTPSASDILAPMALVGTEIDGKRQIVGIGNAGLGTSFLAKRLKADSTYYWSVQAIDHGFAGSPFATEHSFVAVDSNIPPTASLSANPLTGMEPLVVTFNSFESSDPDGAIVSYDWDFGDGATEGGQLVTHTYASAGQYVAVLTVTDNDGASSADSTTITVDPRPPATGIDVTFTVTEDRGNDYDADIVITNNTQSTIDGWTLEFDLTATITSLTGGSWTHYGNHYAVSGTGGMKRIRSGKSTTISYSAIYFGTLDPPTFCIFNGLACTFDTGGALAAFKLGVAYPNPFNPTTVIPFGLPETAHVKLTVYDMLGREVAHLVDQTMAAGRHQAVFNASNLASGVYFYRLNITTEGGNQFSDTNRMLLLK